MPPPRVDPRVRVDASNASRQPLGVLHGSVPVAEPQDPDSVRSAVRVARAAHRTSGDAAAPTS